MTFDGEKKIKIEADDEITIDIGKGQSVLKMNKDGVATINVKKQFKVIVGDSELDMTTNHIKIDTSKKVDIGANNDIHIQSKDTTLDGGKVKIN
jgi:hypothetical protein